MIRRRLAVSIILLIQSLLLLQLILSTTPPPNLQGTDNSNHRILQEILEEISERHKWEDPEISTLGVSKLRVATSRRYQIRIRPRSRTQFVFKFSDQLDNTTSWTKFIPKYHKPTANTFQLLPDLVREMGPTHAFLDAFSIEGPFDLFVAPGDDLLALSLPMNASYVGLKRVIVREGVTVEVRHAREVSVSHSLNANFARNGSVNNAGSSGKVGFYPFCHSSCVPLLPINVIGSASLVAYRTRNPGTGIRTAFLSKDTIELLPEKCYADNEFKGWAIPFCSLSLRVDRLEKLTRSLFGDRIFGLLGFVKVEVKASSLVQFVLELEKSVGENETVEVDLADWRTRPTVERLWFEVLARVEAENLKPLVIKKTRPFIAVDTAYWSNLLSNISFTKFPSVLVPPEPLTLDVKW